MTQLVVEGVSAHFAVRGSGDKTLFLIHGAGGNSLHWMETEPPPGWRLVAPDLPGHGKSGGSAMKDITDYARWVGTAIKELGGCDLLAGHSMGGAITMTVALQQPELLRGIILVGTGAKLGVSDILLDLCRGGAVAKIEDMLAKVAYGPVPGWEQIKEWYRIFGSATPQAYLRDFSACNHFDIRLQLKAIRLPALIVCGKADRLTPFKYSEYLAEHLEDARLEGIPDAGHMVMLEQPEHFNRILADFCAQY
ncbi:alpha/beta fold hydrolase [Dethiobacter alkaliphilus]|uniref:alpha/beta fold hydrolase n=1 Tax=Dethiobacter alkaliphilus TaxID=427926 RepID=UPI002226B668|nr:alpha/beta hydrolase [Dethiobacter alkaliphilus]MCW3489206.1 alpha/beta hydrolase [Dethiobacter alkaliphilus]